MKYWKIYVEIRFFLNSQRSEKKEQVVIQFNDWEKEKQLSYNLEKLDIV